MNTTKNYKIYNVSKKISILYKYIYNMSDKTFEMPSSIVEGRLKIGAVLLISSIISLILVIISGKILDDINKSGQKSANTYIQNAHKWAAWTVGISSTLTGLTLIAFILLMVFSR